MKRDDILVVFDFRRYQRDVLEFASGASAQGAVIILVTDIWNSPIASLATHVIACPVEVPTAFDSAVGGLAMVEPRTGNVKALSQSRPMGRDRAKGETYLNYVVPERFGDSAGFQAGSTFKAFTLAAAFSYWMNLAKIRAAIRPLYQKLGIVPRPDE